MAAAAGAGCARHAFLRSARYEAVSRALPRNAERAAVVQALIDATGVLDGAAWDVFEVEPATASKLQVFHSRGFVDALQKPRDARLCEDYGLVDDCGAFRGVFELAALEAGGSVQAAKLLAGGGYDTAIWWGGGRHHAKTDSAAGFCYVNDVVLAIFELLRTFERVMYVDIDVHHGDGVEEAFCYSDAVLTCSFHHHAPLFFPGSGSLADQGGAHGRKGVVNVPLHAGCGDETFLRVFRHTMRSAAASFAPSVIVLQCGADALVGDPLGEFNLSLKSYTDSLEEVRRAHPGVPVLLLGGGGYSPYNVARAWAALTHTAAGEALPDMVPEHAYFEEYAPGYSFAVRCSYRPDRNSAAYIDHICATIGLALAPAFARACWLPLPPPPPPPPPPHGRPTRLLTFPCPLLRTNRAPRLDGALSSVCRTPHAGDGHREEEEEEGGEEEEEGEEEEGGDAREVDAAKAAATTEAGQTHQQEWAADRQAEQELVQGEVNGQEDCGVHSGGVCPTSCDARRTSPCHDVGGASGDRGLWDRGCVGEDAGGLLERGRASCSGNAGRLWCCSPPA